MKIIFKFEALNDDKIVEWLNNQTNNWENLPNLHSTISTQGIKL